jgi:hypothetical protein
MTAVDGVIGKADGFVRQVGGYLSYEIIGFPDYPINGCHLNADRPAMAIA